MDRTQKQSDGEAPALKLCEMQSNSSFPLLPIPPRSREIVPVMVPTMDQIELFNPLIYLKQFNWQIELLVFESNTWNHFIIC